MRCQLLTALLAVFYCGHVLACDESLPATGERDDVLVIVNDNAKDSCEIGRYYAQKRGLGRNNIVHVKVPASYYISYPDFQKYRDQIIRALQQRLAQRGFPAANCSDPATRETANYCSQSIVQIVSNSTVQYLVITKGIPMLIADDAVGKGLGSDTRPEALPEPASVDGYLRNNLAQYPASPGPQSGRLYIGRIDGLTAAAAERLVDRAVQVEQAGFYGGFSGIAGGNGANNFSTSGIYFNQYAPMNYQPILGSPLMASEKLLGDTGSEHWRYFLGLYAEDDADCSGNRIGTFYLRSDQTSAAGRAPSKCKAQFVLGDGATRDQAYVVELPPGLSNSRLPAPVDVGFFMFNLAGQGAYTGYPFSTILNWRKSDPSAALNTLCAPGDASCIAASEDAYKEIDSRNVGLAEGAVGYHLISYPLTYMTSWPTGWGPVSSEDNSSSGSTDTTFYPRAWLALPEIDNIDGHSDAHSIKFASQQSKGTTTCYASDSLDEAALTNCNDKLTIYLSQRINYSTPLQLSTTYPTLRVKLWYKSLPGSIALQTNLTAVVASQAQTVQVRLGTAAFQASATPISVGASQSQWTQATAEVPLTFTAFTAVGGKVSLPYLLLSIQSGYFSGEFKIDDVEIVDGEGNNIALINPSFDQGNKQFGTGDWAAAFTSRLNGAAFWGSITHNCGGQYFSRRAATSVADFFAGSALGKAIWSQEDCAGGVLIGDPLYSPMAVGFVGAPTQVVAQSGFELHANVLNGADSSRVTTTYSVDYCYGTDFYVCDRTANAWIATAVNGQASGRNIPIGTISTASTAIKQPFILRLTVTSTNTQSGKTRTLRGFSQPIMAYVGSEDEDNDGLTNAEEFALGSKFTAVDSDGDLYPDFYEAHNGLNPADPADGTRDSDGDTIADGKEYVAGSNPNSLDSDGDGYSDFMEYQGGGAIADPNVHNELGFSPPPLYAAVGHLYSVVLQKTNPSAQLALIYGPAGMQLKPGDILEWAPSADQVGTQFVVLTVDGDYKAVDIHVLPVDGDLNSDGRIDIRDVALMRKFALGQQQPSLRQTLRGDLYQPSPTDPAILDISDVLMLQKKILQTP